MPTYQKAPGYAQVRGVGWLAGDATIEGDFAQEVELGLLIEVKPKKVEKLLTEPKHERKKVDKPEKSEKSELREDGADKVKDAVKDPFKDR